MFYQWMVFRSVFILCMFIGKSVVTGPHFFLLNQPGDFILLLYFIDIQLFYNVVLVSAVQQSKSVICLVCPLFLGIPSHLGQHRTFSRVLYAIQQVFISHLFYAWYQQCRHVNTNLPIHPFPPHLVIHTFVLYVCDSISALQVRSSIPYFQIS